jgi:acetyl-CoA carboxylase biotin carboxyl carrier protein
MAERESPVDQNLIRELAKLLDETGLTEIEVERDGMRVRVGRQPAAASTSISVPVVQQPALAPAPGVRPVATDPASHPGALLSPMVGTAYLSAEPGAMPFVDIGSAVKAGDTVLIIEAMKTLNQIPAVRAGTVVQMLVADGQPVEFGEPLMIIE